MKPSNHRILISICIVLFILEYWMIGMSMIMLKDSALIRQSTDMQQLLIVIIVWAAVSALVVWIGDRLLNFFTQQNQK